jgi:hypothetical protein
MAYRPTWQGHLKLSLVTCPVALYTAINSGGDVHFNLINPKTNNRIKMITTDPDTRSLKANTSCFPTTRSIRSSWRAPRQSTSSISYPATKLIGFTGTTRTSWHRTASWPRRHSA